MAGLTNKSVEYIIYKLNYVYLRMYIYGVDFA